MTTHKTMPATEATAHEAACRKGETVRFAPGMRVGIELPWAKGRHPGEIVGVKQGVFLCVLFPALRDLKDQFPRESSLLVKGVTGDHRLFGFKASVRHLQLAPYPLLFLSYPSACECVSLRGAERAGCLVPARAWQEGQDCPCTLVDLSRTGARLVLGGNGHAPLPDLAEGREVLLHFTVPGSDYEVYANCLVRSVSMTGTEAATGTEKATDAEAATETGEPAGAAGAEAVLGLEFAELWDTASEAVEDFVARARRLDALRVAP